LLRSPKWPDPTADRGKHSMEYALYPHQGRWQAAQTLRSGYEYNAPLLAILADVHKGKLAPSVSFVRLEPANLVLTTVKKAEDSNAWIVQWYNTAPSEAEAVLTLPKKPAKVFTSNFLEETRAPVHFDSHVIRVKTPKSGVMTLRITF